ncbi:MAG: hypothetical protein Q4P06_01355 [Actinomycetaceae bacterium]|nr:hypothetical protein [Actinomycetaceae bacterium]
MNSALLLVSLWAFLSGALVNLWLNNDGREVLKDYLPAQDLPTRTRGFYMVTLMQVMTWSLTARDPLLAVSVSVIALLATLAWVDALTHRLPTALINVATMMVILTITVTVFLSFAYPLFPAPRGGYEVLFGAVTGALVWTVPLLLVHLAGLGLGRGDVRLAPVLGMWLGAYGAGVAFGGLVYAFLIAGAVAIWKLATRRATLHSKIAFGPSMVGGALLGWVTLSRAISWL